MQNTSLNNHSHGEISLIDIMLVLYKRRKSFLSLLLLGILATGISYFFYPHKSIFQQTLQAPFSSDIKSITPIPLLSPPNFITNISTSYDQIMNTNKDPYTVPDITLVLKTFQSLDLQPKTTNNKTIFTLTINGLNLDITKANSIINTLIAKTNNGPTIANWQTNKQKKLANLKENATIITSQLQQQQKRFGILSDQLTKSNNTTKANMLSQVTTAKHSANTNQTAQWQQDETMEAHQSSLINNQAELSAQQFNLRQQYLALQFEQANINNELSHLTRMSAIGRLKLIKRQPSLAIWLAFGLILSLLLAFSVVTVLELISKAKNVLSEQAGKS